MEGTVADARTGKRFPVELPIRIHLSDSEDEQAGKTANVSAAGVYITAEVPDSAKDAGQVRPWRPGTVVEFDMTLPAVVIGAQEDVHIQCHGRVVRVEKVEGAKPRNGVACVIDKYEFVRKS
jgi:PilZ domain-containing protein